MIFFFKNHLAYKPQMLTLQHDFAKDTGIFFGSTAVPSVIGELVLALFDSQLSSTYNRNHDVSVGPAQLLLASN